MRIRVGLVSWRALYARRRTNAAHGVSRGCAAGTSLSPIEANEELTYVEIENPGPGVSTSTRAGCPNEFCERERGKPASGWARNTGERITHPPVGALPWVWRRGSL